MKLRTRLTGADLRHHLRYQGWMYLLAIVLSFTLTSLVYTQTAYRPPQHKRIDIYIRSSLVSSEQAEAFLEPIWKDAVPEMEAVEAVMLLSPYGDNEGYANIQLVTYLAAGEGDIYLLDTTDFKRFAAQGAFVPLEMYLQDGVIDADSLALAAGRVQEVENRPDGSLAAVGETRLFGVPLAGLDTLAEGLGVMADQSVLALSANGGNVDNSARLLKALIVRGQQEPLNKQ